MRGPLEGELSLQVRSRGMPLWGKSRKIALHTVAAYMPVTSRGYIAWNAKDLLLFAFNSLWKVTFCF